MGAILNTYLQVNPIEKLTLRTQFGANAHYRRSDSFVPKFNMDPLEKQDLNEITRRNQEWFDWNWTNTATYMDTFAEKHNLNVMAGFTAERFAWYNTQARRDNVPNNLDQMQEVNAGQQGTDEANGVSRRAASMPSSRLFPLPGVSSVRHLCRTRTSSVT